MDAEIHPDMVDTSRRIKEDARSLVNASLEGLVIIELPEGYRGDPMARQEQLLIDALRTNRMLTRYAWARRAIVQNR
jgi:hypothetical protein